MDIVEVNGVKYEYINPKSRPTRNSKALAMLGVMAAMYMPYDSHASGGSRKQKPNVDIVKEYGLIQLKQSKLSKNQRDWVEWQFEKKFKKVEE